MRLAIISDTHLPRGARAIPDAAIEVMEGADAILHAGDHSSADSLRALQSLGPPVHAIHGNVDSAEVRALLPATWQATLEDVTIAMIHDAGPRTGRLSRMRRQFPQADAVIFGHSHLPLHEGLDGFQIFNPGSPTERRRAPHHTMGVATIRNGSVAFEHIRL